MNRWGAVATVTLGACVVVGAPLAGMALAERDDSGGVPLASAPATPSASAGEAAIANDFIGLLLPPQMANLSPRIEETVLALPVKVGGAVHKGEVVVAFDQRMPKRELMVAEAQRREMGAEAAVARSALAAARTKAARRAATVDVGGETVPLVSGEESAQARFDVDSAEAKLAPAAARIAEISGKIEQLQLALDENELRAPFDGVVSAIDLEPGMTAHVGDVVARVVGGRGMRARIAIPEEASALLLAAHRARLVIDGRVLFMPLEQIPPEPEPASRTFLVEGNVEDFERICGDRCGDLTGRTVRASLITADAGTAP